MEDEEEPAARMFGQAVLAARTERGLSLADLQQRSNVSRSMLSKIERGETSPTLPVASRIARGLGLSLSRLLGAEAPRGTFVITRKEERLAFRDHETGFVRELLSPPSEGQGVEIARHSIPPGRSSGELPPYHRGTRKFVIVEEGRLHIRAGDAEAELQPGDAAYFEAEVTHAFGNCGQGACSYLLVISRAGASG